jgi:hypothetical protein
MLVQRWIALGAILVICTLAIYMRNFAYLCIMVSIHMGAHEYICFFSKLEYFMYFLVDRFFSSSSPVHIFGVDQFNDQSSFDDIGWNPLDMSGKELNLRDFSSH